MRDEEIPMFPQACQVGKYLAAYVERYIPKEVLRLGSRVVRTTRSADGGIGVSWKVDWVKERFVSAAALFGACSLMLIINQCPVPRL